MRTILAARAALALSLGVIGCGDLRSPPSLRLRGHDVCATAPVTETSGAGSTIYATQIYGLYWCSGEYPDVGTSEITTIEASLDGFYREDDRVPPRFRSRQATAILWELDEYKLIHLSMANELISRDSRTSYVIVVNVA